ncbi:AMP-binding protein [Congregibacter litoralis]|uniref:acetate--CoA ligase n=1 Tax=Congregibacter litoralis KT71 TaxID=314285 RepID=A4A7V6_9GAMM|nr:AMP-binding protein [Congregibacter litoralis]EAQ97751.1 3-hydroxypropionyl-CoA synthetase/3-hydroxypropionyl-CoA dehydratase/acrylyl-CoA reductase (NADPH) [Congregibacter litoralis KT71]
MHQDSNKWGRLASASDEGEQRKLALEDPGQYHGSIASRELHWYDNGDWLSRTDNGDWQGLGVNRGGPADNARPREWFPWTRAFDDSRAPFYRWYAGALTNACFNEVDRHVLAGRGDATAIVFEGDRWDPSRNDGKGGPVQEITVSFRQLLAETVLRAEVLSSLGLKRGDRIAFNLPNILEQIFYTQAAKRLGIIYTPVFGGFSAKTLSDRIYDAGATVVITADGGYRNAEVVSYKEAYTDQALDNFIPLPSALACLNRVIADFDLGDARTRIVDAVEKGLRGEITIERSDLMRELGAALATEADLAAERSAELRTTVARELAGVEHTVKQVVVVRYTGQDIVRQSRDRWSHELVSEATDRVLAKAAEEGFIAANIEELLKLGDRDLHKALCASHAPVPVDADWPLFIIYTSGSTGKPKGVVHTHGGWLAGIAHTMRMVFNAEGDDRIYVVGDPGWITGQAYLIAAPLCLGIGTIIAEGSPLFPHAGRFSSIIERHKASIFKAGSTFLKAVMTDPASVEDMSTYDMSGVKVATFCAEPVSPAVQQFGMDRICDHYINSYWATEHGGMVFSCPWGGFNDLQADAKTWPLPWIQAEVRIAEDVAADGSASNWRPAEPGEKGELVITQPYPYLARTIWGDADALGTDEWQGDIKRFAEVYFNRWSDGLAYTQGDYARSHEDGAFTLHGRSDDVINVSGHRIGTEEIEGAVLRDKTLRTDSPVGNVVVVGAPHDEKGETPVAFLIAAPGSRLGDDDFSRLQGLVRSEKGATAVPSDFLVIPAFPETRSGKYMRRTLRAILLDEPLGDLSTLRNPEVVPEIQHIVSNWKSFGQLSQAREIVQSYRFLRLETHEIAPRRFVALLMIDSPPVNSLNERSLDELNTVLQHIAQQDRIEALVVTGARNAFVAGADVKELLEIGEAGDRESAQTPPNAAHTAFSVLENMGKPVIAAVNGPALGGGCELALACGFIVADPQARFGQPEINLNLLPGYGGTQRLVRRLHQLHGRAGLIDAIRLIASGRNIDAREALASGLVDHIVEAPGVSAVESAMAMLRQHFNGEGPVGATLERQRHYLETREYSLPVDQALLDDKGLASTFAQLRAGGRGHCLDRIIDAVSFGASKGQSAGLKHEAELFAEAVCDPASGPVGISAFLERRSAPLPVKYTDVTPDAPMEQRAALEAAGELIALDAPFFAGVTQLPRYQYGMGVAKRADTGAPDHGDPKDAEKLLVFPTPTPGPNEALVYVLASEMNFNDIWAITGIPVSPFDARDADVQVTGSGGVAMVAQLGAELLREGRLSVGQLVTIYSGQSELLSPDQGLDPMAADFRIQGYEQNDGSHAQFLVVQGPQLHPKLPSMTIEEAGSYGLTLGTIHRALFTTLDIKPGRRLFVEGASTGTGLDCLRTAKQTGLSVVGMVSSEERGERVRAFGGAPINRKDERWSDIFTPVPEDPAAWEPWERAGDAFVAEARKQAEGNIDYVVSHAGENAFSRSFQLLGDDGVLTFYGASSGYRFSFMGKSGSSSPAVMFDRAGLRSGGTLLVVYGPGADDGVVDPVAIEAIEVGCSLGAQVAVLADNAAQREFVTSLGFGTRLTGVVSIDAIARKLGDDFVPPGPFPELPDAFKESEAFKEAVRRFSDVTLKPIGSAIAPLLRNTLDKRGLPDVVFERAGRDGLGLATSLVKPNVGKVVYAEDLRGQRLSFYAPQVWMRQRRILMPSAEIRGTHLNTAREFAEMQERIAGGMIDVMPPVNVDLTEIAEAHQAMWENRHAGANYVATHGLPRSGLKTRDELYRAWAIREAEQRGETLAHIDTGSAGALR